VLEAAVGKQHVSFEPPDLLRVLVRRDVHVSDVCGTMAVMDQAAAGLRHPLELIDLTKMGYVPLDARSFAGHNPPDVSMPGAAIRGASFQGRVVAKLILGSLHLLAGQGPPARHREDQRRGPRLAGNPQAHACCQPERVTPHASSMVRS
jgi:hypothetical protein